MVKLTMIKLINIFFRIISMYILFNDVSCNNSKIWIKDWNNAKANEWLKSGLNCPRDQIIFPNNSVIFINQEIKSNFFILPYNGILVLGNNAKFLPLEIKKLTCKVTDKFYKIETDDWFDPRNWNQSIKNTFIGGSLINSPIPHSERVPCAKDNVLFLPGISFKVSLKLPFDTWIHSLTINGYSYDTSSFHSLLEADMGKYLFEWDENNQLVIGDTKDICSNKSCPCFNHDQIIFDKICSHYNDNKCEQVTCDKPIKPIGYCCPICGTIMHIKTDLSLIDFELLEEYFNNYWSQKQFEGILGYISIMDKTIQAVLTHTFDKHSITREIADQLYDYLLSSNKQISPYKFYIESISIISSNDFSESQTFAKFLLIFILIIIICVIFYGVYHFHQTRQISWIHFPSLMTSRITNSQFTFVRFHGVDDEGRADSDGGHILIATAVVDEEETPPLKRCHTSEIQLSTIMEETKSNNETSKEFNYKSESKENLVKI